ncbi:MAG TPA: 2OG-Fe(II) oxygenase, partial [Xanthobacteraceae bacterium]|nr:2OG-Fe(II) oxygenase [Xanthobacteraceae bacterium]
MNKVAPIRASSAPVEERVAGLDWARIAAELAERGCATTGPVLTRTECEDLAAGYDTDASFRSRVVMARHGFGRGEYKYYAYPLPDPIAALRATLYPRLAPIANQW